MPSAKLTCDINAPIERVFALCSDFANAPASIPGITRVEMLTPGPVGVGTKFKETRKFGGSEATEQMEVTSFSPPTGYTLACDSHGTDYVSTFRFEPAGAGTRVSLDFSATPRTLGAKLLSPLGWLMMGMVKKCIDDDLKALKAAAEKT